MPIAQLQNEVETLIQNSGLKPHPKMECSILRTLKMRHDIMDTPMTRDVIKSTIEKMS